MVSEEKESRPFQTELMKHIAFSDSQKVVTGQLATSSVGKGPNCCFLSFSEGAYLGLLPQPFCWIYLSWSLKETDTS